MVAEKEETSSTRCLSPNGKHVKNSLSGIHFPSSFSVKLIPSSNEEEEGFNESLQTVGDVVLSLRCKRCSFLCTDKSTLIAHVKELHCSGQPSRGSASATVTDINASASTNTNGSVASVTSGFRDNRFSFNNVQTEKSDETPNSVPETAHNEEEGEEVFLCAECDIVFPSEDLCCKHMSQVHNLKDFSPQFIREEIISKSSLEAEKKPKRRQVRPPKQYTAEGGAVVPKKFRVSKDTFFSCSKCNVKFESKEVTKFHEQCHVKPSNANEKGFSCPVCVSQKPAEVAVTEIFPIWGKLSMHLWKEHKIDCELHTCSFCKQYKNHLMTKVKEHEKLHYPDANYKCTTCNKSFKQYKQLKTHEKYHKETNTKLPPPQDSRWYTPKECPICKRILADSKCLKKHISAVHNKLKPYMCNICGHTTARKAELQLHVRQHTGEKPYKCPYCSFATGDHNSLRNHKMRHSDTKPYVCPYCEYRCIQSAPFKKHILAVHPGQEVVFLCQLCNHASVNETLFAAHQKDHENDPESSESETNSRSASCNNGGSRGKDTPGKVVMDSDKPKRYWLDDEDDSIEMIVDTGGITIPAPESEAQVQFPDNGNKNKSSCSSTAQSELSEQESVSKSHSFPTMTLCLVKSGTQMEIFDADESANQCPSDTSSEIGKNNLQSIGQGNIGGPEKNVPILDVGSSLIEIANLRSPLPTMTLSLVKSGPPLDIFDTDESANQCPSDSQAEIPTGPVGHIISLFPTSSVHDNIIVIDKNDVLPNSLVTTAESNSNPAAPFLEPLDLSDIICNDHSNDETLERLLGIN